MRIVEIENEAESWKVEDAEVWYHPQKKLFYCWSCGMHYCEHVARLRIHLERWRKVDAVEPSRANMLCDVTDLKGNHCPEIPSRILYFHGKIVFLCDKCFANASAGAYGAHLTPLALDTATPSDNEAALRK